MQQQCCEKLVILLSLKTMESPQNGLQPYPGMTPLFPMRASLQCSCCTDAGIWCKWTLTPFSVKYWSIFTTTKVSSHKSNTDSNLSFNTCLYQYFTREGLKAAGKSTPVQDTQIHNATITMQFREAGVYYHPKAAGLKTDSVMKHRGILCPLLCIPCGIFALLQGSL